MKKLFIISMLFISIASICQTKEPVQPIKITTDSIHVVPSVAQVQILTQIRERISLIQQELDRTNAEYETAILMMLNVRKEDIVNLEVRSGVFVGLKKKK